MTYAPVTLTPIGGYLKNGALLLNMKDREPADGLTVLAMAHAGTKHAEYVTWILDPATGETFWGHYFQTDLEAALADYATRRI